LFHGTQFENVLDVILGILQVHNQGINAKTNENRTKEVDIGGANKGVQQTVHNKVSNLNTTHKEVEVANIGGEISRAKHGNAKQDKNIVITQKELDVKEGESTKTDDPKKTKMTDDKGDMETGIETNDENALEANRLMEFLRSIPEQHVRDCFQKESPSFWSKLNGLSLQDARHRRYLEKLYAKYQRWNDKDYSSTLPDFLSVPIEVLKKYFQKEMQGEDVYLKVHHIDGDGNCMYRALSESRFVIDSVPKFRSYLSMERYKYVRETMYNFAKTNPKLCFIIWKHYIPKKDGDTRSYIERYDSWVETLNENKIWGGQAEYTIFAYAFKVHVICVRQLVKEVEAICTFNFHDKLTDDNDRKKYIQLEKKPSSPNDVVFIWHHRMKIPRHKLGDDHYGNHYSFLSYNEKRKQKLYDDTFILRHTAPKENFYMICSPDVSKSQNEDKPNGLTSGHLSTTVHQKLKESHITTPYSSNRMPTKITKSQQVSQKRGSPQMEKETPDDKLKNSQPSSHSHKNTTELRERPKRKKNT
jgi:hypothetical protein